jgi:hypothetical protein
VLAPAAPSRVRRVIIVFTHQPRRPSIKLANGGNVVKQLEIVAEMSLIEVPNFASS